MTDRALEEEDRERIRRIGRKVRRRLESNPAVKRIGDDNVEMWAVGRFFDEVECGRLMTMIDATGRPSTAYGVDYSSGLRTSYSADLNHLDPFVRKLQQRIDKLLGTDPSTGETLQGQRYLEGQEFKPHVDWFTPGTPAWDEAWPCGGQRAFTAMAYLNTVEEGGETDFPLLDIALKPRAGTLLVWNNTDANGDPNKLTLHSGNPVTRGRKYIVTRWYRCRQWRALG